LEDAVSEIHKQFAEADASKRKAENCRVYAGKLLIALRARIEAGEAGEGVNWWVWYEKNFVRSRRDAERVMKLASADDPMTALEGERKATREAVRRHRKKSATYVSRDDNKLPKNLIDYCNTSEEPDEEGDSPEVIWRRGLLFRSQIAEGGAAYEDWSMFTVDADLIEAAERASDAWKKLA